MRRLLCAFFSAVALSCSAPANADVPPLSPEARAAGFVDVRSVVPNALIDLRYATPNNFTHTQLYPAGARCLVHESLAPGLASAAKTLASTGDLLVFWDCYRPHDVQVKMFDVVPNPAWVAKPGNYAKSHEAGRSVDVTLGNMTEQCPRCLVDMGTDFDDFSPRATAFATDWRHHRRAGEPASTARCHECRPGCRRTPASGGTSTARAPVCSARSLTYRSSSRLTI